MFWSLWSLFFSHDLPFTFLVAFSLVLRTHITQNLLISADDFTSFFMGHLVFVFIFGFVVAISELLLFLRLEVVIGLKKSLFLGELLLDEAMIVANFFVLKWFFEWDEVVLAVVFIKFVDDQFV